MRQVDAAYDQTRDPAEAVLRAVLELTHAPPGMRDALHAAIAHGQHLAVLQARAARRDASDAIDYAGQLEALRPLIATHFGADARAYLTDDVVFEGRQMIQVETRATDAATMVARQTAFNRARRTRGYPANVNVYATFAED